MKTNGQASAVGTIVSAGYGFLCGAYMPISNFGEGLQRVLSFLPGTYGTALFRNHALRGVYAEMTRTGFPVEVVEHIKDSIDCNLYFFGSKVSIGAMTGVMAGSVADGDAHGARQRQPAEQSAGLARAPAARGPGIFIGTQRAGRRAAAHRKLRRQADVAENEHEQQVNQQKGPAC